jgi:hypothetical protein
MTARPKVQSPSIRHGTPDSRPTVQFRLRRFRIRQDTHTAQLLASYDWAIVKTGVLAMLDDGGERFEVDVLAYANILLPYYADEHDTRSILSSTNQEGLACSLTISRALFIEFK